MPPSEPWRRNVYVMAATVFAVFTGFAFVLPFLPLFVRELGVREDESVVLWSGALIGIAPLLAGAMAPVWGRLADRYGHKRMAVRALLAYVALLVLSARAGSAAELLLLRAGVGLAGGIGPLSLAMASAQAPREMTGRAVGLVQGAQILAAAAGPLIGGALADRIGIRATFLVTAGICAGALSLVVLLYREGAAGAADAGEAGSAQPRPALSLKGLLDVPSALPLLALLFFSNFVSRSFTPVLPLHLEALGVPASRLALATGALISGYSMAAAVSAWVYGAASRRFPPRLLLGASLGGGAACVLPMAFVPSFPAFLALAVCFGAVTGGTLALGYTIGALTVPEHQRATAFGFFSGAALFGGAVAPSVAGVLAHWELRGIYYLDALVYVALLIGPLAAVRPSRSDGTARPE